MLGLRSVNCGNSGNCGIRAQSINHQRNHWFFYLFFIHSVASTAITAITANSTFRGHFHWGQKRALNIGSAASAFKDRQASPFLRARGATQRPLASATRARSPGFARSIRRKKRRIPIPWLLARNSKTLAHRSKFTSAISLI